MASTGFKMFGAGPAMRTRASIPTLPFSKVPKVRGVTVGVRSCQSTSDCLRRGNSYASHRCSHPVHHVLNPDGAVPIFDAAGFGNPLFLWGGISLVGLALYQTFSSPFSSASFKGPVSQSTGGNDMIVEAEDEQKPWLTRYAC